MLTAGVVTGMRTRPYIVFFTVACGCAHPVRAPQGQSGAAGSQESELGLRTLPPQPGEERWHFIEELKAPMWTRHPWGTTRPGPQQADLSGGVRVKAGFPDPKGRLQTAYDDLQRFFAAGGVPSDKGAYTIETIAVSDLAGEAFRLEIGPKASRLMAGDVEGIRRGIFHLEDEMLRARGAFLSSGKIEKTPIVTRRISRCFFGPIKRPPRMRDELMDDVDYYPDQYLNRLAHEGVNGLWLTIEFRDLVATKFTPQAGKQAEKRLAKLRRTVASALRHGIRTYIFAIEPGAWAADDTVLNDFPELGGALAGRKRYFCPSSETAAQYLYESVNTIFKAVPDLGGMINISHGERPTTCLSALRSTGGGAVLCPRCSKKAPWEILHGSLSAMERGMHAAAPDAEMISWLYMPQVGPLGKDALADWVYEIPAHTPKGVILQFNFESGVERTMFGRTIAGGDYWISSPGPSSRFERISTIARKNQTHISAKIQTSSSHESATVPYVPVPSLLYQKFAAMRRLGVSHTMLSWYFGSYPGVMNKAAGELSAEPFPASEDVFLRRLAALYWRDRDIPSVVQAWKHFSEGYQNYPLTIRFQYFGPMHSGPVWPLFLKPKDAPLSPTWQLGSGAGKPWPPSGDRVGESLGDVFTLEEAVELTRRMSVEWDRGVAILSALETPYGSEPDRISDIGVARALGIQFRSGYNILRFYFLREKMLRMEGIGRLALLKQLSDIVREELSMDERLLALCEKDSRLGFHSEAEGYLYFPEKIRWRMDQLRKVLANDVPELEQVIRQEKPLFPEYTGKQPAGPVAESVPSDDSWWANSGSDLPPNLRWQALLHGPDRAHLRWATSHDAEALYVVVADAASANLFSSASISSVIVKVEPRRLWPAKHFAFTAGINPPGLGIRVMKDSGAWVLRIPHERTGISPKDLHPIRVDVRVQKKKGGVSAWRPDNPIPIRANLGTDNPADNPADLGWMVFGQPPKSLSIRSRE